MNILIIYLGSFYILLGSIFLFIPLIYLEVGKPKDLIKAFLNLLIGIILIIKNNFFNNSSISIFLLVTALFIFYLIEDFIFFMYQINHLKLKIFLIYTSLN